MGPSGLGSLCLSPWLDGGYVIFASLTFACSLPRGANSRKVQPPRFLQVGGPRRGCRLCVVGALPPPPQPLFQGCRAFLSGNYPPPQGTASPKVTLLPSGQQMTCRYRDTKSNSFVSSLDYQQSTTSWVGLSNRNLFSHGSGG